MFIIPSFLTPNKSSAKEWVALVVEPQQQSVSREDFPRNGLLPRLEVKGFAGATGGHAPLKREFTEPFRYYTVREYVLHVSRELFRF